MNEKHVILGGNGPIGAAIKDELIKKGKTVISTGRKQKDEKNYISLNALNQADVLEVSKGASNIYISIGLQYSYKVWEKEWPVIIKNAILAAKTNKCNLIFFDNIYIYGPKLQVPITEEHSIEPISRKGKVRKEIYLLLEAAMKEIQVLIVRASDFFGPNAKSSLIHTAFLENMLKGKKPIFIGTDNKRHSYAYTLDLARATVMLALEEDTYNQVWHLPTYQTNSIYDILKEYNKSLGTNLKLSIMSKFMHKILKLFMPILKDVYEMRYQFDNDYVLNYDKFLKRFRNFENTKFEDAIEDTVKSFL